MQFIENTRSRSSLIEYFRHFFIDTSIFEHQGGAALEGEGKAASSLPALQNGTPGCARRGRSKQRPYEGNPPRLQNEHGAPGKANALYLRHAANAPAKRGALARAIRE